VFVQHIQNVPKVCGTLQSELSSVKESPSAVATWTKSSYRLARNDQNENDLKSQPEQNAKLEVIPRLAEPRQGRSGGMVARSN
jgi:hypothetical protein